MKSGAAIPSGLFFQLATWHHQFRYTRQAFADFSTSTRTPPPSASSTTWPPIGQRKTLAGPAGNEAKIELSAGPSTRQLDRLEPGLVPTSAARISPATTAWWSGSRDRG